MAGKYIIVFMLSSLLVFAKKPLIFYCGATMVPAMKKIAARYTHQTGRPITIIQGGSGALLSTLASDREADLYLPGHPRFIRSDIFDRRYRLGSMRLAIFAREGITDAPRSLDDLIHPTIRIALGCIDLGSIGKQTRDYLIRHKNENFYAQVMLQSLYCAVDSRDLVELYLHGHIDVGIIWKPALQRIATKYAPKILALKADADEATPLILAIVHGSRRHKAAEAFATYVSGQEGQAILLQEGFDVP